jgi:hypothetical protein
VSLLCYIVPWLHYVRRKSTKKEKQPQTGSSATRRPLLFFLFRSPGDRMMRTDVPRRVATLSGRSLGATALLGRERVVAFVKLAFRKRPSPTFN